MARTEDMEARLWRWGEFVKSGGDGSGYPVKSTLHEDWSPPSSGTVPGMKIVPMNDAPQTHRMIDRLSSKQKAALVGRYVRRLTYAEAGLLMDCQPDTVKDRIEKAQQELARMLSPFKNSFATSTR